MTQTEGWGAHISGLVVEIAVVEHLPVVLNALLSIAVRTVLQLLLNSPHVHGTFDDLEVVLEGMCIIHHDDAMAIINYGESLTGRPSVTGSTGLWNGQA